MEKISWRTELRKIGDLKEYSQNPRKIGKDEFKNLVRSIKEDGYHNRLLINPDNTVIGGHQRIKALLEAGYTKEDSIEVLVPTVALSGEDFDRVNIRDNLEFGVWDFDILGNNFEPEQLIDWGLPPSLVGHSILEMDDDASDKIKETKPKTCPHCGEILN